MLNPSGMFVTRKGRILWAVVQESFHVISKLARKNLERFLGSVGEGKGWIYFLSIFRSFLESSCDLAEAASSSGCVTKQRMRLFFVFLIVIFIFNWLMIALQYCVDFCHTSNVEFQASSFILIETLFFFTFQNSFTYFFK